MLSPSAASPARVTNGRLPSSCMFFGPKGEPVEVAIKTFEGQKTAKGVSGQNLMKVMGSSGLIYGCKTGECGTCEVKMDGRVVRTCVAKLPKKEKVAIDVTGNKVLKGRKSDRW